jgi:AraC family transcriptional regulator
MQQSAASASGGESDSGRGLRGCAEIYERVLVGAGGTELEALRHVADRPSVYAALYASPAYALSVPPLLVPRLAVNLTPARVTGRIDGDRIRGFDARRHSLFLTPAGAPAVWRKESPSRHLCIYFNPDAFDSGDDDVSPLRETPALMNATVPGVGQLADQLAHELQGPGILDVEAADSLARLLLIRVVRFLQRTSARSHALTPKSVAHLRDFVVEHLSERILVADLARQVGLSSNYFALCFTEQTGRSPHSFVLALRLERAEQLLSRSQSRLADIAHDCGFASQQHLSNAIRRHLNMTPSQYRALHKR